ncbi:glycosyltransferase family 2 protein [Massilia putida]|uniref:glycosyltransferase family 2 protein n=1 Tax=Massilia putida TaxID=1141883 RepID=UPI000950B9F8|nr:glycosyltransferase family 2 protein [Massilia putida]
MSAKVFVIIVTYNGSKWVTPCFSSLRKSTVPLHTIVIDNGSQDDTLARIAADYPEVEIVNTGKNHGFGKANNIGMELAYRRGADYVFLLNQDAWIDPDAVEKLVDAHQRHPDYGIISPMHLNGASDGLDYGFSNYIGPNKCRGLYSDIYLGRVKDVYDVGFVNAAAWSMTRECLERVGGFSPSFFHYGEDDNYTQRLHFHKLKLGVLPTSRIYHDREQRPPSKFFESGETFRREVIARSSNPNANFSFGREWVSVFAHLVYALARVNTQDVKLQLAKARLLAGIDKAAVRANRERSKTGRAAFLDLDGSDEPIYPASMPLRQVTSVQ